MMPPEKNLMPSRQIPPHGGELKNLLVSQKEAEQLNAEALEWTSLTLSERQVNELELILNGEIGRAHV